MHVRPFFPGVAEPLHEPLDTLSCLGIWIIETGRLDAGQELVEGGLDGWGRLRGFFRAVERFLEGVVALPRRLHGLQVGMAQILVRDLQVAEGRVRGEVRLEDGLQDDLRRCLGYTVIDARDPKGSLTAIRLRLKYFTQGSRATCLQGIERECPLQSALQ
jgi:hypothetical protein